MSGVTNASISTARVLGVKARTKRDLMIESKELKAALRDLKGKRGIARALAAVQHGSENGDASAAYALATWYLFGKYVKKDHAKAVTLLKLAAKQNISEALFDLAVSYEEGAGTRKNEKKAYELYLRASIWGDEQAIAEVGRCLFYGIGIRRSRRVARFWLDRAESLGLS